MHQHLGKPLLPGPLHHRDLQHKPQGTKQTLQWKKKILKNWEKRKYESKNHLWWFWALHSPILTLNSIPKAFPHQPVLWRASPAIPQINLMELIILAVHCSLPEEHLEASVWATTAWNSVRQNPGTSLALGLSPVLCWMRNGSKITRVQKSKYRDYVTLLQNCATQ